MNAKRRPIEAGAVRPCGRDAVIREDLIAARHSRGLQLDFKILVGGADPQHSRRGGQIRWVLPLHRRSWHHLVKNDWLRPTRHAVGLGLATWERIAAGA